jgi:hypothetical protein
MTSLQKGYRTLLKKQKVSYNRSMFKKNTKHLQPALISAASELPEKQLKLLKRSWAHSFYHEFFCRIDEEFFAVLYSSKVSRPNVPVNVMVGLEVLKAGFGWSDEELYENYCFNLQVRYALGYDRLGDGDFAIRTLYYFRERLSKHYLESGENLLEQAFEQVTDAQLRDLQVRTGMQRMDSTQIASNIVDTSRLQLLVEAIQRVHRIISEADQQRLVESFEPYIKGTAGHYTYRVKGKEAVQEHLQQVGATINHLLTELKDGYADDLAYQVLERIFVENFNLVEDGVCPKENRELASGILQSVDDLEASYRTKGNAHYKGYVANLTETCDPQNDLQLITKVQVAPNNVDDSQLLAEALPNLQERSDLDTLLTDGGFGGEASDTALDGQDIKLIQTAIRGPKLDSHQFHLADFDIHFDPQGTPSDITCPYGQKVPIISARTTGLQARFDPEICTACPFHQQERCRTQPQKRDPRYLLAFTPKQVRAAQRRKHFLEHLDHGQNLRAAVEATVRSVKHPFRAGKLPVRGQFRVSCLMIASAIHVNVRRICRYRKDNFLFSHFFGFSKSVFQPQAYAGLVFLQ